MFQIDGFDELFLALDKELEGEDRYSSQDALAGQSRHIPAFDERVIESATLDDLDLDLALTVMREYCVKLKRAPVTRDTLLPLMREQGLVIHETGADKVSAGAILLFGKNTQAFFPHAAITVTESGKKRELFEGNLIAQHRALLAKLESEDVNPRLKVKKRRQHDERTAYPPRSLVELLVNVLVHRDYDVHEPARIDIMPGAEIAFSNPGGLTQKVARRVTLGDDGRFTLTESVTDTRNPALCDIFFGMSAMEREGTGLIDVGQLMTEWGGGAAFTITAAKGALRRGSRSPGPRPVRRRWHARMCRPASTSSTRCPSASSPTRSPSCSSPSHGRTAPRYRFLGVRHVHRARLRTLELCAAAGLLRFDRSGHGQGGERHGRPRARRGLRGFEARAVMAPAQALGTSPARLFRTGARP